MDVFIGITILLVCITVIGHGIWLVAAATIRLVLGIPKKRDNVFSVLEDLLRTGMIDVETHRRIVVAISHRKRNQTAVNRVPIDSALSANDVSDAEHSAQDNSIPTQGSNEMITDPLREVVEAEVVENEVVEDEHVQDVEVPSPPNPIANPHVAKPIDERAREYVTRRQAAELAASADRVERDATATAHVRSQDARQPARPPRRNWGEWLSAFLEESNIRWGELVGGLLIVSCSTALVISFWSEISARPLLKFGVFNGVIAALFLVGIHAAKKWNLPSTSQGVLLIALLLVPLNFLAIAAFTEDAQPDATTIIGELISIVTFSILGYLAARILTPRWPISTVVGVVGLSVVQLLVRRWIGSETSMFTLRILAGVISAVYFASFLQPTRLLHNASLWTGQNDDGAQDNEVRALHLRSVASECWALLGTVSFALLLCIAFLVVHSERAGDALQNASLFGGLLAAPGLAISTLLWKRSRGRDGGLTAVASIAVGIGSVCLLAAMVVFAWPQPAFLFPASAVAFAICTGVSIQTRLSHGHYLAATFLFVLVLLAGHILIGTVSWRIGDVNEMLQLLTSVHNGKLLIGAVGVALASSYLFRRFDRQEDQATYLRIAAAFAAVSCIVAMALGFGRPNDPAGIIFISGTLSVGLIGAASQLNKRSIAWSASALLLVASLQWLTFGYPVFEHWFDRMAMSMLVIGTVFVLVRSIPKALLPASENVSRVWRNVIYASIGSVGLLLASRLSLSANESSPILFAWLATICLVAARNEQVRGLYAAFEISAYIACAIGLHQWQIGREIVGLELTEWLQPVSYHWQTILLASMSVGFVGMRTLLDRFEHDRTRGIRDIAVGSVGAGFAVVAVFLISASAIYSVVPGIGQELSLVRSPAAGRLVPDISRFYALDVAHPADNVLMWLTWGIVAASVLFSLRFDRDAYDPFRAPIVCLALLGISPSLMAASLFSEDIAVASAVRWTTAIYFVVGCLTIWTSNIWHPITRSLGYQVQDRPERGMFAFGTILTLSLLPLAAMLGSVMLSALLIRMPSAEETIAMTVAGSAAGILTMLAILSHKSATGNLNRLISVAAGMSGIFFVAALIVTVSKTLVQHPVVGPNAGSVFRQIGLAGSYVIPMVLFAIGFIGSAHRFRSQRLAFSASILCNVCTTAAVLFFRAGSLNEQQWIQLSLINSIVSSATVLVWAWWRKGDATESARSNELVRVAFGISCSFAGLAAAGIGTVLLFDVSPPADVDFVAPLGLVALLLLTIAKLNLDRLALTQLSPTSRLLVSTAAIAFAAVFLFDGRTVLPFQMLLVGILAAPIASMLHGLQPTWKLARTNRVWQALCFAWIIGACVFSLRTLFDRSISDAWSFGGVAAAAMVSTVIAAFSSRIRFIYIASALLNLSATIWYALSPYAGSIPEFVRVNLIAFAMPVVWWSLALWQLRSNALPNERIQRYIRFVTVACCFATALMVTVIFGGGLIGGPVESSALIAWFQVGACLLAVASSVVARAGLRVGALSYVLGLSAAGVYLEVLQLQQSDLIWSSCLVLSAFGLIANYVASRQDKLKATVDRFVFRDDKSGLTELPPSPFAQRLDLVSCAALVVALLVVMLGFVTQFTSSSQPIRLAASQAILAQVFAVGLLPVSKWKSARYFALLLAVFGVIAFGWSWLPHDVSRALDRIVIAAVATAIVTLVYAVGLIKLTRKENAWTQSAIELVPWLAGTIVLLISAVLVVEGVAFAGKEPVVISYASIVAVAVTLLAVAIACLTFAIWPGRDPLSLQREQLGRYVYAAELVMAMLFAHLRMSMPWLFQGFFQQVWPLVVMVIAFSGVGFAELTKRLKRDELSIPLERTGAFLPMLPAIGIWIVPSQISFSLLMLVVSVLYAILASMRRSFGFSVLAVLAGNAGLWHLLHDQGISILEHPQIWLIPPALCVLIAASFNRKHLSESQNTSIRYACGSLIYVSSTADIFINGVANAPWLPLVLAGLSLAGIFVGILLRIRTFLFLGVSFLMVSLLTVVWHAAVDLQQTWIWYVSGIVTGILILVVFAVFEKKRQTVIATLGQLRQWKA